ncbi:class I adenylate-forming enzyme family protein [Halochromatium sp.]
MNDSDETANPRDQHCDLSPLMERRRALGDASALRISDRCYSYAQLATLIDQRATALVNAGVAAVELVLCPTTPVLDSILMQWALARLGVAMLPVRADLPRTRRESLIRSTGAEWCWAPLEGDPDLASLTGVGAGALIRNHASPVSAATRSGTSPPAARPRPTGRATRAGPGPDTATQTDSLVPAVETTPAVLVETSGSSAEPKIAMLSAANVTASCLAVNKRLDLRLGDRWLCVLPRPPVSGLALGYRCAIAGAELIIESRFDAEMVQRVLWDEQITHLSLVPAMLERLLCIDPTPPPLLRVTLVGGQGLDRRLARRAVTRGWPVYLGYGMTETFSQIAGNWIGTDGLTQGGLIPLGDVELNCPSCDEGPRQDQPLRIRAPMLMLGYANPTRTPGEGLVDGWLQTSDLACRRSAGGLEVRGRADDMVLIAGINVLPAEIEHELARLDQITEVAVVGVPDPTWGHRLAALYTGNLEPLELETWCRSHLSSHQRPRAFARLDTLPRLSSGKRDRQALIACAQALVQPGGSNTEDEPDRADRSRSLRGQT